MTGDFQQVFWDAALNRDAEELIRLALREDLGTAGDLTSAALVPADARGGAGVVARQTGILAGLPAAALAAAATDPRLEWTPAAADGDRIAPGQRVATMAGPARSLLAAERLVLNLLGRLSGVATLTRRYVDAVAGTRAAIYDTRKTTPGWRRLEKYAVRAGGGRNHRGGLDEAILIKDNHLAWGADAAVGAFTPAEAVAIARRWAAEAAPAARDVIVEVEVDSLAQLEEVLPAGPDIVLLDNMPPEMLRAAVARRAALAPGVELEASGGVNLDTVRAVAASGVERISVGALTHSAVGLDLGLDWLGEPP